jgi:hypothetical protein
MKAKIRQLFTESGWPVFTTTQTETRIALCRAAICPQGKYRIKFKKIYQKQNDETKFARTTFPAKQEIEQLTLEIELLPWGGEYSTYKQAPEGAFYPFVRSKGPGPIDTGIIWIGTKYDFPKIYIGNTVANWLCPYNSSGTVMTEPFAPLADVITNWSKLADKRFFPMLDLPPVWG